MGATGQAKTTNQIEKQHRILIVEDEEHIRKVLKLNLEMEGYEVIVAEEGKKALKIMQEQHFDMLLLDVMLPEISGLDICEQIRLRNKEIGIIILSAKDQSIDRVQGLKLGADDYLTKPFHLEELLLRMQKVLKLRTKEGSETPEDIRFGNNYVNFQSYMAKGQQGEFRMTKKEVMLLKLLVEKKNEVVSRKQILQRVWGYDVFPSTRTIDNFILNFRKYFEEDPKNPIHFESIRGVGYRLNIG